MTEGGKGEVYCITLNTSQLDREKAVKALDMLTRELKSRFDIDVLYARADTDAIHLIITGSPFSWTALLMFLPTLLGLIGIAVFAISVYQAVVAIPSWVWGCLIIGGLLILFGPAIGELILRGIEEAKAR